MQHNGATVWARKTISSDIFVSKPDKWFKIWFFLVNRVNYKDNAYKRGECFIPSGEIETSTQATTDQVKKCLKWLRDTHSISTRRSTRGIHIKVLKYNIYQDLGYYTSTREALEKHQRSTTIGEVSNKERTTPQSGDGLLDKTTTMSGFAKTGDDFLEDDVQIDPEYKTKKKEKSKKINDDIQAVFDLFSSKSKAIWHLREIERVAAQALFDEYGLEKLKIRIDRIEKEKNNNDPMFPLVTTPSQLLDKMPNIERYFKI